ncbi:hypothetical protein CcaverHIS002_0102500 [Cutaneotrichosporon cavernicola]|nr:hypothetical protein CcaverHIS002_0102500 [Cutaneotrichosporon cavernicola]
MALEPCSVSAAAVANKPTGQALAPLPPVLPRRTLLRLMDTYRPAFPSAYAANANANAAPHRPHRQAVTVSSRRPDSVGGDYRHAHACVSKQPAWRR